MPELAHVSKDTWLGLEVTCTVIFTIEYTARLLVCDVTGKSVGSFVKNPMNVCDLLALLPFYLYTVMDSLSWAKALGVIRTVRLIRLFRIFKLGRYSSGLQLIGEALKNSSQALWVLSFFLLIGIVLFSSAIFYVEKLGCPDRSELWGRTASNGSCGEAATCTELAHYTQLCRTSVTGVVEQYGLCCDEHDSPLDFPSIIAAFWWAVVTMTTVGFGEVYPKTDLGRCIGTVTMLSGILLIALPVAIIGRNFQEAYDAHLEKQTGSGSQRERKRAELAKRMREMDGGPTLTEMARRLRLMKIPDAAISTVARQLADDLEEVSELRKEILSMQSFELAKQVEIAEHFDVVLTKLCCMPGVNKPRASGVPVGTDGAVENLPELPPEPTSGTVDG
eukprot:CAMPEP_0194531232 /NCGR_PEP_ID=MMETSP0253-20130528/68487_1 /TAXON_ID=2966 /ORGANISM="Noctiluca scintillans" /LENGTH=390 /DNA_ID=CAMNT_0039376563 /DNA_START=234 /DNA_END=1406 /DNA_ORIENTATION=+